MPRCAIANTHPQNVGAKSVTNKVQNLAANPENVNGRTYINDKNGFIECKQIEARGGLYECTFGNNLEELLISSIASRKPVKRTMPARSTRYPPASVWI